MSDAKKVTPALLIACIVVVAAGVGLDGITIKSLWAWFVVPFGAPGINFTWAIGLAMLVRHFQPSRGRKDYRTTAESLDDLGRAAMVKAVGDAMTLAVGALIHHGIGR